MSRPSIQPNDQNCSIDELEVASKAAPSLGSHRRLLALKMLLMDLEPATVAEIFECRSYLLTYRGQVSHPQVTGDDFGNHFHGAVRQCQFIHHLDEHRGQTRLDIEQRTLTTQIYVALRLTISLA